jgi:putative nucleotidyltransferase with HDIG domain
MVAVRTKHLKAGMLLADDVRDIKGRLLMTKGKPIGPEHIRIFKIWGIPQVQILGPQEENEASAAAPLDPERLAAVRTETEFVFRYTDRDHPAIREIFTLAVHHRASAPPRATEGFPIKIPAAGPVSKDGDFLQKFIEKDIVLPEIPSVVFELNEVIANPMSSTDQMAQVINRSPSLTALLLKIVNSSFYGLPSKVDRVSLAVTMVGTRELSALALGISIMSIFRKIPSRLLSMPLFLQHSLACGIVTRLLAAQKNLRQTEQMFTAGLLHDIGRLVTFIYFPDEALAVMRHAAAKSVCLYAAEQDLFGCHHGHIGKYIFNQWKLPMILENNVCFHHDPMNAPDPAAAALVHVADLLVNALAVGTSGERFVPPLDPQAWEAAGLSVGCLEMVVTQAVNQFNTLELLLQA